MLNKYLRKISQYELIAYERVIENKRIPITCYLPILFKCIGSLWVRSCSNG